MKRLLSVSGAVFLSLTLAACSGSAAGTCASAEDVAAKVTSLSDDLKVAQDTGKLNSAQAGDIGAQMLSAGAKYGSEKNHRSYCEALENIRKSAGL
jgi:NAD(P)H-hydrate repair Nnr-like enzyme with NAD(P)H-hydrate dehydratase domain